MTNYAMTPVIRKSGPKNGQVQPPPLTRFGALLLGFAVLISRSVWQAEEAVANLPLRLAVRVHCSHQVLRGTLRLGIRIHSRGMPEYSQRTPGVLAHSTGIPPRDHTQR
jgi:hypothetical protein